MKNFDLAVIGGCASGLAAAINCKRMYPDKKVAVIEKLPKIGKKILATGNGKCNLTNIEALSHNYRNKSFTEPAMNKYPPQKVIGFFESMGLLCYSDSCGRVYPESNTASSVLDALRIEIERLKIDIICDFQVSEIKKHNGFFEINSEIRSKNIIIATGGKSSPSQGSDGSGYALAKKLGHSVTSLSPALVPLAVAEEITKSLKGIRARDVVLTLENGKALKESRGEILFADFGLSGIAAMELAADAEMNLAKEKNDIFVHIDFAPSYKENQLYDYLKKVKEIKADCSLDYLLNGMLPKQIGVAICKTCGIYKSERKISTLNDAQLKSVASKIKDFSLRVTGTKGFQNSQVTCGGIPAREIDSLTMQSKICEGLYFAGEIIDVDGACGGFNLQWAWASGMLAAELR